MAAKLQKKCQITKYPTVNDEIAHENILKKALAIFCAAKLGLITQTDYNAVSEEFGDIGERSNYNKYLANPQRFSPIDIESTTNFLTQTP